MDVLINDPSFIRRFLQRRRENRADRYDEVWNGVYVVAPTVDNEHYEMLGNIYMVLHLAVTNPGLGKAYLGVNVSDRADGWRRNYRCTDAVAILNESSAIDCESHFCGGPDFVTEIITRRDRSRRKLDFYAQVNTREVLLVDRYPWALELYRLADGALSLVGRSTVEQPATVASDVIPLAFTLVPEPEGRPRIRIDHADGDQSWSV